MRVCALNVKYHDRTMVKLIVKLMEMSNFEFSTISTSFYCFKRSVNCVKLANLRY